MIRRSSVIIVVLLIFLFCHSSNVVVAAAFPNGGFESSPIGGTNDWTWPTSDWAWDGSISHSGTYSARVSRVSGGETASLWSANISVQPSTNYTLTFWMRTQNATYWPSVFLYQYTTSGSYAGPFLIAYANIGTGTSGWTQVNYHFQSMANAARLRLRLYLYTSTTGSFWFDDFSLDQGAQARFPFLTGFPVVASGWATSSSPSVADINQDGSNELLIGAGNKVNGWNKMGQSLRGFPIDTGDRSIIAQIALADLDHDNRMEIVAGTRTATPPEGQCHVFAWKDNGVLLNGWPISVAWNTQYSNNDCWITSVVLADIKGDHNWEILASSTNNTSGNDSVNISPPNLYAWHADGSLVSGSWPDGHTSAGFYGAIGAGDLNGDGLADVLVARDHHYLNAYSGTGVSLPGWPVETYLYGNSGNYQTDYRVVYGYGAPVLADLDGDGTPEYIVIGNVDGPGSSTILLKSALFVLEPDGTRRLGWETPALGNGVLTQRDQPQQAPAVADLNNDGQLEIVAATNDGWIRAYQANKTVLWAFNYTQGATLFASEPVIGDIDGDGELEIVFGTYVPMQGDGNWDGPVGLWALKADGKVVPGFPLTIPTPGIHSAPTLADLDGDGDLEILAATVTGQIFVWDTSTPYNPARLPWPTGRHDLRRSAEYTPLPSFDSSAMTSSSLFTKKSDRITYTIHIASTAPIMDTISLTNVLPSGISFIPGSLKATSGSPTESAGVIHWNGRLSNSLAVDISYDVVVTTFDPRVIVNSAVVNAATIGSKSLSAKIFANHFFLTFISLVYR